MALGSSFCSDSRFYYLDKINAVLNPSFACPLSGTVVFCQWICRAPRHVIKPFYSGVTMFEGTIYDSKNNSSKIRELLKGGKIFAFDSEKKFNH